MGAWVDPKCAQVCGVAAPKPDPEHHETKKELLSKWKKLNPDKPPKGFILEADPKKPVIAIIADGGSSDPVGLKQMEDIDTLVRKRFPGYDVYWGMQAAYAIRNLQTRGQNFYFERGIPMWSAKELLERLAKEGITKVAMELLMVHESSFSANALNAPRFNMDVKVGMPFLSTPENRVGLVKALESRFGDGKEVATVLVGHGVLQNFTLNDVFIEMDKYLRDNYKNVYCGTLHGPPGTEQLVPAVKNSGCKRVRFISLMISTSDHIAVDVMGSGPESWKSQIGLPADMVDDFATNPLVLDFFVRSIGKLVGEFS
jgi:cobalamin biosynthesis Co2+ chelatase CbiK